ncbi:hypothetical protein BN863_32610 [Formosa agariphila KMM 3901]|uniref:Uncharacterized protein n=1 Tax=Formosa agariphila (strain DSM 15362 / KCTC 12365 / LMG 23005 / KMM 3901 / M-2Alg 35-1) TaxID=1347342 RepID=T2KR33_FORAG|nr:hypothetical protein [Formosa agariphila]CDF80973.1 hypothetical protein BN863_32610 [Formosa agariphila KMM 3901]
MKKPLLLAFAMSLCALTALNAQEIEYNNNVYEVKGTSILLNGYDITESLTLDDQKAIFREHEAKAGEFREMKRNERIQNRAIAKAYRKELKEEERAKRMTNNEKKYVFF